MRGAYPIFWQAVWDMAPKALLPKRWATAIARKGLKELGTGTGQSLHTRGTFSMRTSANGYAASADPFPDGTTSMQWDLGAEGASEACVLVNVAVAGSGVAGVTGDINATVSLASVGVAVSDWVPVAGPAFSWTNTGSATVGLVQLQVK